MLTQQWEIQCIWSTSSAAAWRTMMIQVTSIPTARPNTDDRTIFHFRTMYKWFQSSLIRCYKKWRITQKSWRIQSIDQAKNWSHKPRGKGLWVFSNWVRMELGSGLSTCSFITIIGGWNEPLGWRHSPTSHILHCCCWSPVIQMLDCCGRLTYSGKIRSAWSVNASGPRGRIGK